MINASSFSIKHPHTQTSVSYAASASGLAVAFSDITIWLLETYAEVELPDNVEAAVIIIFTAVVTYFVGKYRHDYVRGRDG